MEKVLKRGMIQFKRIQGFYWRCPTFQYERVLIRRAVLSLEESLICALTCNFTMYIQ